MYVVAYLDQSTLELREAHDCKILSVYAEGDKAPVVLAELLAREDAGTLDPDEEHVWLDVDALRAMALGQVPNSWPNDFAAMLDVAKSEGWLDADGSHLRARLEWITPAPPTLA